jgi:hypothetical protein
MSDRTVVELAYSEIAARGDQICSAMNMNGVYADDCSGVALIAVGVGALKESGVREEEILGMVSDLYKRVGTVVEATQGD